MVILINIEKHVRSAVLGAISLVDDGYTIGLGSGNTMACATYELGKVVKNNKINIKVVPTSLQIEMLAINNGLHVINWIGEQELDLAIDGADQVERNSLNLIKGGGAALTREKIVDSNAKELIIVVDERKITNKLGSNQLVPVEIIPFGYTAIFKAVKKLSGEPKLRKATGKVGPVITDNGNLIVDVNFKSIDSPSKLERELKMIPGVVETGLFLEMADKVYVGKKDNKVEIIRRE